MTRTYRSSQDRRQEILSAAHDLLLRGGLGALTMPHLAGASKITITDPYLRMFHQQRNLMELLETISKINEPGHEVVVHVLTVEDEFSADKQVDNF